MRQTSSLFSLSGDEKQDVLSNSNKRNLFQSSAFGAEDGSNEFNQQKSIDAYNKSIGNVSDKSTYELNPFLKRNGELVNPYINYQKVLDNPNVSAKAKDFITKATGLTQTPVQTPAQPQEHTDFAASDQSSVSFDRNLDPGSLVNLDITTELPKLSASQIKTIIEQHFGKSNVITPKDAEGIYKAQQQSGMSALAILSIGALESGYGTSSIANKTNNIWGYGAVNSNPAGGAHRYDQMSQGAAQFANEYLKTYYGKYGAKSIYSAGTGSNPAKKGYAYYDDGTINTKWARDVGSIMSKFYNTAKGVTSVNNTSADNAPSSTPSQGNSIVNSAKNYIGTPYVWGGESMAEGGMDCSGFVYNALKDAGYKVGRTTAQGYRKYGTAVSKSNMQPGDLVFFGKNGKATHIGIYIGNGQMIHSSGGSKNTKSNPGKGVSIANVDYRSDFLEARRY